MAAVVLLSNEELREDTKMSQGCVEAIEMFRGLKYSLVLIINVFIGLK